MKPWVVMRSHNDMPIIADTLRLLHEQTRPFELIVFDNESTDGTLDEVRKYTDRIVTVTQYVPGRVLNQGMEHTEGEVVAFVNSDCTPQNRFCLEKLLEGFSDEKVAAAFGRQIPRPDCIPLQVKDTEYTYGDGSEQHRWRNCFSMACSAIRRSVWEDMRFNENLCIAEDMDWTYRARNRGYSVLYAPESIVMHSHNYTLPQFYRRMYKEGRDEALIFEWTAWRRSFLRYSLLPFVRQILSDEWYFMSKCSFGAALSAPIGRAAQLVARRRGFLAGNREIDSKA